MRTELGKVTRLLAVLSQIGEEEYVRDAGKRLAKKYKESYKPKKDTLLMNWMTEEEKQEFLNLS